MNNIVSESRICIPTENDGGFLIVNSLATSSFISIQNILEGYHFRDSSLTEKKTVVHEEEMDNRWTPPTDASTVDKTAILMVPDIRGKGIPPSKTTKRSNKSYTIVVDKRMIVDRGDTLHNPTDPGHNLRFSVAMLEQN
ncbi:hypothetical protein MTR_4g008030 [Medicago truncatula]|uniref:Uncharacterized protein n=1 Tax=Medicago truncatula TaxID=3880 RepID=A0A072UFZ1_MEDTR|nr:hypothetical protein MTR_4g008030 [Medicago truncatula]